MGVDISLAITLRTYGVRGVSYGGCVDGNHFGDGPGAMRRSGHAHLDHTDEHWGWLCIKGTHPRHRYTPSGRPSSLVWHEVGHIWRRSWTQAQCDAFARRMVHGGAK